MLPPPFFIPDRLPTMTKVRCKIIGKDRRDRLSVKLIDIKEAKTKADKGVVKILDDIPDRKVDVQTTALNPSEVRTPEDPGCKGKTSDGSPCRRKPSEGKYCFQHDPEQADDQ